MADAQASSSRNTENIIPIRVGRYELGQTLGSGTSSVVKLARHLDTGHNVAIKVFDKKLVLADQKKHLRKQKKEAIKREISIMKMCRHPNVVRIIEVMATKKNIYIVLEHVTGGELYDKISQTNLSGMGEGPARRYFQQLICGVDYCHSRGVFLRDLKPQNLLVDADGVLKVSDFGMSVLGQQVGQDGLLHTACSTPHYTAPEVLNHNGYEGAKADIWSCGVILFFTVAGYLPFRTDTDNNTVTYEKIRQADFTCPYFFSKKLQSLVRRILDPNPATRITINEIYEDEWFKLNYQPPRFSQEDISFDDTSASCSTAPVPEGGEQAGPSAPAPMNAFQMFSTYLGFDLIGNLLDQVRVKREAIFISQFPVNEIISGIEHVASTLGYNVKKRNYQMSIEGGQHAARKGQLLIAIEIYEMTSPFHMVELRKAGGDALEFHKFYKALCSGLIWKAEPIDTETDGASTSTAT